MFVDTKIQASLLADILIQHIEILIQRRTYAYQPNRIIADKTNKLRLARLSCIAALPLGQFTTNL